ncbi:peptidase domain-containing ABC transporter [Streptococcus suis]|uniref:peptidase domain-containing ABC transporter n=1 Tax=Streptococcus suis TaxID=1307 RepID=UPI003757792C
MKIKFQQQSEHSECGLACVAMLIDYFSENMMLTYLRQRYGVPNGGYNFAQMTSIFNDYNIKTRCVHLSYDKISSVPMPCIAFWKKKHFVIIERVIRNKYHIIDPAIGKLCLDEEDFKHFFSQAIIYIDGTYPKKRDNFRIFKYFLKKLIKHNKIVFSVLSVSFIVQLSVLLIPYFIRSIIDNTPVWKEQGYSVLVLTLIMISLLYFGTNHIKIKLIAKLQTTIDRDSITIVISHLLELPYSYFTNRNKGELVYTLNSNTYVRQVLIEQVIELIINFIFAVLYLVAMFFINATLTYITLILVMLISVSIVINSVYNKKLTQNEIMSLSNSQNYVNEIINNISTIKSTASQRNIFKKWSKNFEEQLFYEVKRANYSSIFMNFSQSLQVLYTLIIYVVGIQLSQSGTELTLGSIVGFSSIGVSFISPLISILSSYNQIFSISIYVNRLLDILDTPVEAMAFGNYQIESLSGKIEVRNLSFRYSKFSSDIFKNVTFSIHEREKIAIIGESGSGKSTLLKLLSGFYKPSNGLILVDQQSMDKFDLESFRKKIGVILQEDRLFSGTLRDNITLGREISDEEIWNILLESQLDALVSNFPLGLDTIISENGNNLSGGQRQKISLIRTLISKPSIIFLDEPTSSMDVLSEKQMMDLIFKLDCTVVVVSHRISLVEKFDKILVIKDGKIEGFDSHDKLIKDCPTYISLYYKK